jgi:16S rRNA (adenine1518-N6/adenine1519-N6)-dimethyltransferase
MITPKKVLNMRGIRPIKRLGQAFLQDQNILHKIVAAADIHGDETVVEIGAGLGIMTGIIAAQARRVIAIEVDPVMVKILKEHLQGFKNVEIIETDVLQYDFSSACADLSPEKVKVIGNVPYQISSPILFRLMAFRQFISMVILMLQKEVVDRIIAPPGTKDYGIPSVILSMYCQSFRVMDVPGSCFYPEPKVTSSVLKLIIREKPLVVLGDDVLFRKIVQISFSKRRKTLLNNLRHVYLPGYSEDSLLSALQETGIDGIRRAETLSAEEFGALTNHLISKESKIVKVVKEKS